METNLKYPAILRIVGSGYNQHAYFDSVEAARDVLRRFGKALAAVREFSNSTDGVIFEYEGAGAFYVADLRKALGASVEVRDVWSQIIVENDVRKLVQEKLARDAAKQAGVGDEFAKREEKRQVWETR